MKMRESISIANIKQALKGQLNPDNLNNKEQAIYFELFSALELLPSTKEQDLAFLNSIGAGSNTNESGFLVINKFKNIQLQEEQTHLIKAIENKEWTSKLAIDFILESYGYK